MSHGQLMFQGGDPLPAALPFGGPLEPQAGATRIAFLVPKAASWLDFMQEQHRLNTGQQFPSASRGTVEELAERLGDIGLGGFMRIGRPGQTLLEIPVGEGRFGAIVIGGLNPVAILEENGVRVHSRALAGLIDFKRLFHYSELEKHLKEYL